MTPEVKRIVARAGMAGECLVPDGHGVCSSPRVIGELRRWLELPDTVPPREVVDEAKERTGCGSEACLYTSPYVESKGELDERFKPAGPWQSRDWLSNSNIDQVLDMYVSRFPRTLHVPFQMIDFPEYGGDLAATDWKRVAKRYNSVVCVVNTDRRGGAGKHWVCVYVDVPGCTVEYFDSAGQPPPDMVVTWLTGAAIQLGDALGEPTRDVLVTSMQHQRGESECGVYCLFYIVARLAGVPYRFFEHTRVPDSDMEAFRAHLFRRI